MKNKFKRLLQLVLAPLLIITLVEGFIILIGLWIWSGIKYINTGNFLKG